MSSNYAGDLHPERLRLTALDRALQMYSTTPARELPPPDADGIVATARTFESYLIGEQK
ncbi:hypothetical protein SEA_MOLLYMUR_100 [Gordonia phage Mollymur]|uniref:Uncharacterized protein n=1 Tax=Gordonia phage Mollymur TaxID=2590895 RepID=A0A4Y6EBW4_9CAUD|nr:hypothetical protein PQB84_gp026 [Gordonia phage Mollymur]QDF15460.1 hypothetical protein SEA_MOLLYMUR_100 [Gordonia phage Mollymur]